MDRWKSIGARTCAWLLTATTIACAAERGGPAAESGELEAPVQSSISAGPELAGAAGAPSNDVQVTSQALDSTWVRGPFRADGNQSVALPGGTHVCVLTRVAGSFQGYGETARVWANDVQWILSTQTQQPGVSAEAHCFTLSKFQANSSSRNIFAPSRLAACGSSGCQERSRVTANSSVTTFINGMGGKWEGNCEFLHLTQGSSISAAGSFRAGSGQACGDLDVFGWWAGFTAGNGQATAKFWSNGPATTFESKSTNSSRRIVLAPTSQAMCHFTRLEGDFNGDGEYAQIRAEVVGGVERWVLNTRHGSGGGVVARARCYLRDQR